jgi:hypothetical protein
MVKSFIAITKFPAAKAATTPCEIYSLCIWCVISRYTKISERGLLEPYAVKVARTVLRGGWPGNGLTLLDVILPHHK